MKRILTLPYPDKSLNPNRKSGKHWAATKKVKDAAFEAAFYMARIAYASVTVPHEPIPLTITFTKGTKARFDLDNAFASCKSYMDGIASGMKIDDQYFCPIILNKNYVKGQYFITVEIG